MDLLSNQQRRGLLWVSDQPVTETSTWQNTTLITDIHVRCGVQTHNLKKWATADPHLRPRGHWNRPTWSSSEIEYSRRQPKCETISSDPWSVTNRTQTRKELKQWPLDWNQDSNILWFMTFLSGGTAPPFLNTHIVKKLSVQVQVPAVFQSGKESWYLVDRNKARLAGLWTELAKSSRDPKNSFISVIK